LAHCPGSRDVGDRHRVSGAAYGGLAPQGCGAWPRRRRRATGTSNADRKQIVRFLVERVAVQVRCDSELVDVTIHWAGGYESQHEIVRPVATYAQLSDYERLLTRLAELREAGRTAPEIATALNAEGFHLPKAGHIPGRWSN
jgi:hypothetical protein